MASSKSPGSGSVIQWYGSADPELYKKVTEAVGYSKPMVSVLAYTVFSKLPVSLARIQSILKRLDPALIQNETDLQPATMHSLFIEKKQFHER